MNWTSLGPRRAARSKISASPVPVGPEVSTSAVRADDIIGLAPRRADHFIDPQPWRADDFIGLLSRRADDLIDPPLPGRADDIIDLLSARADCLIGSLPTQELITIPLIEKASDDLRIIYDRTGLSRTDIVNRAISLYAFIDAELRSHALLIVRRRDGKDHLIKLL
jgi:hypothetical protein